MALANPEQRRGRGWSRQFGVDEQTLCLEVFDCYEIQVLDSFGLEGMDNEWGGLYKVSRPKVDVCLPPLLWQTYDVDFTAPRYTAGEKVANARITIHHNGVVVQDVELPGATSGRQEEGPAPRGSTCEGTAATCSTATSGSSRRIRSQSARALPRGERSRRPGKSTCPTPRRGVELECRDSAMSRRRPGSKSPDFGRGTAGRLPIPDA